MSVLQNINGSLYRMDASDLVQLAAIDTEGILGGTPGATTNGQTLVDQLATDDVQAQTDIGQIKTDLPNLFPRSEQRVQGAKNHLRNEAYTQTIGVVTFTVDADGIIDVDTNGQTTTAAVSIRIYNESSAPELPQGDWILNGCPTGGASTTYEIYYMERDSAGTGWENICRDYGSGVNISRGNNRAYAVVLQLRTGQTFNHLKFKPMIRLSTDTDPTFAPFAMTNRELTYTHKTYHGTTDANSNLASNIAFNAKRFGLYAVLDNNAGTSYALQRPYSSDLTAFWVYNGVNASTTANKGVTIHYFEYN